MTPRFESGRELLIAGLRDHFTVPGASGIPKQWQRLAPYLGRMPGQIGRVAYGVCFLNGSGFDYLSGVEVMHTGELPGEFTSVRVPAQRYAVFSHEGHVSRLYVTLSEIEKWFAGASYRKARFEAEQPDFFERYGERFDPTAGSGDIEVWVPVEESHGELE